MTTQNNNTAPCNLVEQCDTHRQTAARRAYADQRHSPVDNAQITELLPMVPRIVQRVVTYCRPPLSYDDLISAGTVGLVKAARDYDPSHQAEFKTYAYIRIRGAVLDELRRWSFVPAGVDKQIRRAAQASLEMAEQTGTPPTDEALAEKLGISIERLYTVYESARAKHFVSIDQPGDDTLPLGNLLPAGDATNPHDHLEKNEMIERLAEAISQLNQRQRQIILLYYQQQLTMKEIAEIFDITEPRVSQLHASALMHLSARMGSQSDAK